MGGTTPAEVIEATGTSTPAQGQGNREERRKQAAKAKRDAAAAAKKAAAENADSTDEATSPEETVVVPSKPAKVAFALGRGARKVGKGVLDANLRGVGHKVRSLKRFVPVVDIEVARRSDTTEE